MAEMNNPAERLYQLLKRAKKERKEDPCIDVWKRLLGVSDRHPSQLFYFLGRVMALPVQIKELVERQPDITHITYLKWMSGVEAAFSQLNLLGKFSSFIDIIDGAALYGLEVCSEVLSRQCPEQILDEPELQAIKEEVDELVRTIKEGSLEVSLKDTLLKHLQAVLLAIQEYPITGPTELRRAFEGVVGAATINQEPFSKIKNTKEGIGFWKIIIRVSMILSIIASGFQIMESGIRFLPPPGIQEEPNAKMEPPYLNKENIPDAQIIPDDEHKLDVEKT